MDTSGEIEKLKLAPAPGFHRHWFNDTPKRINDALIAGFRRVLDANGDHLRRCVGKGHGGAVYAYAMEIQAGEWKAAMEQMRMAAATRAAPWPVRTVPAANHPLDPRYIPGD